MCEDIRSAPEHIRLWSDGDGDASTYGAGGSIVRGPVGDAISIDLKAPYSPTVLSEAQFYLAKFANLGHVPEAVILWAEMGTLVGDDVYPVEERFDEPYDEGQHWHFSERHRARGARQSARGGGAKRWNHGTRRRRSLWVSVHRVPGHEDSQRAGPRHGHGVYVEAQLQLVCHEIGNQHGSNFVKEIKIAL